MSQTFGLTLDLTPTLRAAQTAAPAKAKSSSATPWAIPDWVQGQPAAGQTPAKTLSDSFETIEKPKSTQVDARLDQLFKDYDAMKAQTQVGLDEFKALIKATTPNAEQFAREDIGSIENFTGGSAEGALAALRGRRKTAASTALDRSLGDLKRLLSNERMASSAGADGAAGGSSYLSRLALDKAGDLNARFLVDDVDQERRDREYLDRLKLSLIGSRQGILDPFAQRPLFPSQQGNQSFNSLAQQLGLLLNSQLANTFYGVGMPYQGQPAVY